MTASLLIIGTELVRGVIADGHVRLIAGDLDRLGWRVRKVVIVPDDGSIRAELAAMAAQDDLVVVTGGLGPTSDDLTRRAVAEVASRPLKQDADTVAWLKEKLGSRYGGSNEVQTWFPEGFRTIENPNGTARGFWGRAGHAVVACLPGPPREMDPMWEERVLPLVADLFHGGDAGRSEYSVFLVPEAKLEDVCASLDVSGVRWGTRFQDYRISLYLTGGKTDRDRFAALLADALGPGLLERGDVEAVDLLDDALLAAGGMISGAESCTGALVAKLLTDRPGSSAWFWGCAATYANEAKHRLLGVPEEILDGVGPVSSSCALAMAEGIRKASGTLVSYATTGYAGPTGDDVGLVWFGFSGEGMESQAVPLRFAARGRDQIRRKAAVAALILARAYLAGNRLLDMVSGWQYI